MLFSWMNNDLMWIIGTLPRMVRLLSYLLGMVCLMQATRIGFALSGYPFQFSWKSERLQTLFYFSVGATLIYFPSTLTFSSLSLFKLNHLGNANDVIAYHELYLIEGWQEIHDMVIKYASLIGIIAFVRGWSLFVQNRYFGERNNMVNAVLYMLGGILFINMIYTFCT